jgi:hypothetical protein
MWFAQVTPDWSGLAAARRDVEKPTKKLPTDIKDQVNQVIAEVRGELLGVVGELKAPLKGFVDEVLARADEWEAKQEADVARLFPKEKLYQRGYVAMEPGLRTMTVKGVEAIPRKYPAFEPEKVKPAEMKGMGLPEAQAGVELLGEEFCIAKVRRKGAVSVQRMGQLRPFIAVFPKG